MSVRQRAPALITALLICGCATKSDAPLSPPAIEGREIESSSSVLAISFSPDSRYLAHLTRDELSLWDVFREESVWSQSLPGPLSRKMDLASANRFAVVDGNGINVWNIKRAKQPTLLTSETEISFILFDDSAEHLACAHSDGSINVWNLSRAEVVGQHYLGHQGSGWRAVMGSGFGVVGLHGPNKLRILDLGPSQLDVTLEFDRDPEGGVAVAFEGRSLASVNPQGAVEIRALPEGTISSLLTGFTTRPQSMTLSPDGSVLAVAVSSGSIELWDTKTNEHLDTMESTIWPDGGLSFSSDGNSLAWVEGGRTKVRYWLPVLGVVEWTGEGSSLIAAAQPVCTDTASIIRFRLAAEPYASGVKFLQEDRLEDARMAFATAQSYFPSYPGLSTSSRLADERYEASIRAEAVRVESHELADAGQFPEALAVLDEFLRKHGKFGEYEFRDRATALRNMLDHFNLAEKHRKARDEVDAIVEFSQGVALVPELENIHPEYDELRERVLTRLTGEAEEAFQAENSEQLLKVYSSLVRLRPLEPKSLLRAGKAQERLGNHEEARKAYEAIEEGAGEYVEAHRGLARMARESGDLMQAKITLWQIRKIAPDDATLAAEYAEVFQLMGDHDSAVTAWNEVARMQPDSPEPLEVIAQIEEERENWEQAGSAYHEAVRRSDRPRPLLLLRMAEDFEKAEMPMQVLAAYREFLRLDLAAIAQTDPGVVALGPDPKKMVWRRIRDLGYIRHRGKWISKDQFLSQQGWVQFNEEWMRPEEAKLREVASLYTKTQEEDLRVSSDEHYRDMVAQKKISNGMNRREVIQAWGFFEDHNVLRKDDGQTVFEQLLFKNSRRVYLKNGLVCFSSE